MIESKLSSLMGEKRLKVIDLARELGIKRNAIDLLYKNEAKRVDVELLNQLCNFFECTPNDILQYTSDNKTKEQR